MLAARRKTQDESPSVNRPAETHSFIRIGNGRQRGTLWLDEPALEDEIVRGFDGASEQCDGCGNDIAETGEVGGHSGVQNITCTECGTKYEIRTV